MQLSLLITREELNFQLFELHEVCQLGKFERYAEHDATVYEGVLDLAYQIASEKFLPHASKLDREEPEFDGDRVHIIPEVGEALLAYREAGFFNSSFDADDGGLQLPWTVSQAALAVFASANIGTLGYAVLTVAAANMLNAFGSAEQIEEYLQPMIEGRYFGTMCMSEPHAGSSLGDLTTKAVPNDDGTYRVSGSKMWISGGDHDLAENIVHMVLARIPGSPDGVAGISLFLVPKRITPGTGGESRPNGVRLAGLNHKMGWRGTVNAALNFGEQDDCTGYLIGEPNRGLSYMFHMLNEARIAVGLESVALASAGYNYSLDYARTRLQGRAPDEKDPSKPQVPIIEHSDIRRMLLQQKSTVEGSLSLLLYCAMLIDRQKVEQHDTARRDLSLLLDLLTPIAKGWPSEYCANANKLAIQILGGYGYTRDYPVERLYRDNRLNAIHDGTTGIQAIDLLGRKVMVDDGRGFDLFVDAINDSIAAAMAFDQLDECRAALQTALDDVVETTRVLRAARSADTRRFLANATLYLEVLGHVSVAWMWLDQGVLASKRRSTGEGINGQDFYAGKLLAMRYFFRYELPAIYPRTALLRDLDDTCVGTSAEGF